MTRKALRERAGVRLLLLSLAVMAIWTPVAAAQDPVIAAAGDIACDPAIHFNGGRDRTRCRQQATSDLLVGAGLAAVLPLGDIQYHSATLSNIQGSYDPSWGRVKSISRPVIGNHEGNGTAYFDYFNGVGAANGPAGPRGKGWYSFDVGTWHLVALNSNCADVGCTRRLGAGAVAPRRPRGTSDQLHARLLAPSALQLRPRRQQHLHAAVLGALDDAGADRPVTATATTTSASPRWTETAR